MRSLFVLLLNVAVLSAATPPTDYYTIARPAAALPNGVRTTTTMMRIDKLPTGSYVSGVVIVKTRAVHMPIKGERTLQGSVLNVDLERVHVRSIDYTALPNESAASDPLVQATGLDRMFTVQYDEPIEPYDLCKELMKNPDVEYAVPMRVHQFAYTPNDARFNQQGHMQSMKMPGAWDVTKGSKDVLIAIVDSGTDWQHEDLASKIWSNPKEIPNNNKDDDGNGYIDDIRGWDFVGNVSAGQAYSGQFQPDNDPRVNPSNIDAETSHGTMTAGCAGAATNNAKGVASTGFECTIIPIKCGTDQIGVRGIFRGYEGIKYAADLGAHIINCSWGGPGSDPSAQDIVNYATAKGSLVVAATGNNGVNMDDQPFYPACAENVLAVGSVNNSDVPSGFSNYGWAATTYAPGEAITSTYPNNSYNSEYGTSFSCPLVAGICGLIKTKHMDWTPLMIMQQVRSTSDALPGAVNNRQQFWGRVNATNALLVNSSFTSGSRLPGLYISKIVSSSGNTITQNGKVTITVTVTNALASAPNATVSLQSLDPYTTVITTTEVPMGTIGQGESKTANVEIELGEMYPWYEATIQLGFRLKSNTYINYELIQMPVRLPTSNTLDYAVSATSSPYTFDHAVLAPDGALWATGMYLGTTPVWIRASSFGNAGNQLNFRATAFTAISANNAWAGGGNGATAAVLRTTNGGTNWTSTSVSTFASTVDDVHFFDANNGICIGSAASTQWGFGRTTNGGAAWAAYGTKPQPVNGEKVIGGSVQWIGDTCFFASSNNRVYRTVNKGQTWTSSSFNVPQGTILGMAFRDGKNGVMLYRPTKTSTAAYLIANSTDAGGTWKANVFSVASLGIVPETATSPGGHHVLVGQSGEAYGSDDNGVSWQAILSRPVPTLVEARGGMINGSTYCLMVGDALGVLTYFYAGPNAPKKLEFSVQTLDFGTINPTQTRNRFATLNNVGAAPATIDSTYFILDPGTPDSSYRVSIALPKTIQPSVNAQFSLRCYATSLGNYGGKFMVKISGVATPLALPLKTTVSAPTGVQDKEVTSKLSIYPVPARDVVNISGLNVLLPTSISIIDERGATVISEFMADGSGHATVSLPALSSGMYRVIIRSGLQSQTLTLPIVK
ncbi:hypothetical protein BH10BAC6_BH10BAC6_02260 [soil metagenome]